MIEHHTVDKWIKHYMNLWYNPNLGEEARKNGCNEEGVHLVTTAELA